MAYLPKQLAQSNVASTTETTVYTVATGVNCIVKQIVVSNVTASAAVTSLSIVASGGSAGVTNRLYEQMSVPANSSVSFDLSQVMASGGFISVKQGTSSAITTTISGVEFAAGSALLKDFAVARRTSGNITLNSTSWANVDTGLDLTMDAAIGDYVEVALIGFLDQTGATYTRLDVASVVSGSVVNTWSTNGAESASSEGVGGWTGITSAFTPVSGATGRVLASGDISSGTVTLRLRYRTDSAVNKVLNANSNNQLVFMAKNYGPTAGGAIPHTLLDAKGDLIVASAADTAARLAVGTNGQVLTADSAQATGVKWAASGSTDFLDQATLHATYGDDFDGASLNARWTRRNIVAGDEAYQEGGGSYMRVNLSGGSADKLYLQTAPAGDFSLVLSFTDFTGVGIATMTGLVIVSTTGAGVGFSNYNDTNSYTWNLSAYAYSSTGTNINFERAPTGRKQWFKLRKSGTNYYGSISHDGANWSYETAALSNAFTVDRIGFGRILTAATSQVIAVDRFNVI